jgi:enoyl-CoA hydratase
MGNIKTNAYAHFNVEVRDRIAFISFNRPDKMNAVNQRISDDIPLVLKDFRASDDADVAVVTGEGRAFSIGGDLQLMQDMNDDPETHLPDLIATAGDLVRAHLDLDKPIIAAINGPAMGAGAAMALLCDIIIMERHATISDGHLMGALTAGDGGALIWPLAVGLTRAKKYLLTADWISAEEAERIGLVSEVVDTGDSLRRATEIAKRFAGAPQVPLRFTKRALNLWLWQNLPIFEQSLALEAISISRADVARTIENIRTSRTTAMPPDPRG